MADTVAVCARIPSAPLSAPNDPPLSRAGRRRPVLAGLGPGPRFTVKPSAVSDCPGCTRYRPQPENWRLRFALPQLFGAFRPPVSRSTLPVYQATLSPSRQDNVEGRGKTMTIATATHTARTATRKRALTVEEKKAQAEALHQSISDQVEALRDSDWWTAFFGLRGRVPRLQPEQRAADPRPAPGGVPRRRIPDVAGHEPSNVQGSEGDPHLRVLDEEGHRGGRQRRRDREAGCPVPDPVGVRYGQTDLIDPAAGDPGTITAQLSTFTRFRGLVQAVYFSGRVKNKNFLGGGGQAENEKGLRDARQMLHEAGVDVTATE